MWYHVHIIGSAKRHLLTTQCELFVLHKGGNRSMAAPSRSWTEYIKGYDVFFPSAGAATERTNFLF
ncbi:hypothetical protein GQ43DRAFT_310069 [Delitschia confertaspora ATCC 74209]|uniref:Uncharacterized protein n=1 Tax=Delitschia confertaspora ATCC 74209 TaxID=1513339 RepID=A0A9P4JTZ0_9PLEO|nr:hypothetical protein GQ43DRAFT_310069 [Delitschia confertaspora ATCC 74209]